MKATSKVVTAPAKSPITIILDNGHGGMVDGEYQTRGKRSPTYGINTILYEGEFTRKVVRGVVEKLKDTNIDVITLVPEEKDISLTERVKRTNEIALKTKCVLISIHTNESDGIGTGIKVYSTTENATDKYADMYMTEAKIAFPEAQLHSEILEGAFDCENYFYLLKNTKCSSIITGNFFMDNEEECKKYLLSDEGVEKIVDLHVALIKKIVA